jgi:hypothetical protein
MNSAEKFILKLTAAIGAGTSQGNSVLYSYNDPGAALTPRPTLSHARYPGEGNRKERRAAAKSRRGGAA